VVGPARQRGAAGAPAVAGLEATRSCCAQRTQALVDALVAAVDLLGVVDDALALGRAEGRDDQRHTGADVGADQLLADQAARGPLTTTRWGSHRMRRAPIDCRRSTKNRRDSNIFSKISTVPSDWVAATTAIDVRSAGKPGHGASSILGMAPPRSGVHPQLWPPGTRMSLPVLGGVELDAEASEGKAGCAVLLHGRASRMSSSPPVTAASTMNEPTSM
jgi:hypothetical protein